MQKHSISKKVCFKTCYENHFLSMTMDIRIEIRIFDQIVTSVSFGSKTPIHPPPPPPQKNAKSLKKIVYQTAELPPGSSYLFMKYDAFRQMQICFKECIIFKSFCTKMHCCPLWFNSTSSGVKKTLKSSCVCCVVCCVYVCLIVPVK